MKRSLILGLLLSATVLTACGGSDSSTGKPSSNSSTGSTQPSTSVSTGDSTITGLGIDLNELKTRNITVTFWHAIGAKNQEYLNDMIGEFNKIYPNITIEHSSQGGYGDVREKILTAIPAETTPVMAQAYPDHVADYLDAGAAVKLNDYVNDPVIGFGADDSVSTGRTDGVEDFVPGFWKEGSSYDNKGSIYSVPFTKSTEVVFMNTTWMQKNKLTVDGTTTGDPIVPTKWENEEDPNDLTAMINLCRKIKSIDSSITPLGYDSDDNLFITLSQQLGIPYTSLKETDGVVKGSNDFANEEALQMVKKIKGWYDEGLMVTKGTLPNNTYTSTKFTEQNLIMSVGSTGGTKYNLPALSGVDYEFNVEVYPLPQYDLDNPAVISQGPSVTFLQNSKIDKYQTAAAWVFYKFVTNTENSAIWAILTGYEPVRLSSFQSDLYQQHLTEPVERIDEDGNPVLDPETEEPIMEYSLYQKVANMTVDVTDWYFTSPAFKGSATTRDQVGAIISTVCLNDLSKMNDEQKEAFIMGVFEVAWTESNLAKG